MTVGLPRSQPGASHIERTRFRIVFQKLAEARLAGAIAEAEIVEGAELQGEAEEIAELRRIVREITEPEPRSFTTT